jgi:DNA-directed RNA polymerase subunit M/transcription elongation factor TFIIS
MKTINHISRNISCGIAVLAIASLMSLPTFVSAQEQVKGAQKLMQLNAIKTVADAEAVKEGDMVVMSCPKCKDSWVTIVVAPTKTGAKPETNVVARHECPGCTHKYVIEGHGKAKTDKLVHVCKMCGSEDAFCCVMKKGTGPTPGMVKK